MEKLIIGLIIGIIVSIIVIDHKGIAYQLAGIGETKPTSLAQLDLTYGLSVIFITAVCTVGVYFFSHYITKKQIEAK
ncbi:hypothetical protein JMA_04270 [Jeotgalibacillus malaysiensis]|uniref:Uncharacterized protein n=1 Tax=Jeotgalibacillus malaysiensis TaxID=1508404 RepID=A0A0B5ANY2_9BACL|nr:hypothetical protein [Jeotgalibacillus malaysiensis]AJD89744.1 hypothetical protein JMA_04270 [Jeotgalibacillus malaysiensis]